VLNHQNEGKKKEADGNLQKKFKSLDTRYFEIAMVGTMGPAKLVERANKI
jgi:hypothetical protein